MTIAITIIIRLSSPRGRGAYSKLNHQKRGLIQKSGKYVAKGPRKRLEALMHQSIPAVNIPPGQTTREFFERAKSPPPGKKIAAKPPPLGQKVMCKKTLTPPPSPSTAKQEPKLWQKPVLITQIFCGHTIDIIVYINNYCCGHTTEIMVNIEGLVVLNSELLKLIPFTFISHTSKFYQGIFSKILKIFQSSHIAFCWILAQTKELGNQSG